jgi:hypothetical protein
MQCVAVTFPFIFVSAILTFLGAFKFAIVCASEIYDALAIVDTLIKELSTVLHGEPTHFLGVLAEIERRQQAGERLNLSRLRFVLV